MIGTIDIKVNAAHPNMPLSPVYTFLGSPQQVRVINVPKQIGNWKITAVQVTVNYPDNSSPSVEATLTGGCWSATLPAPSAVGQSLMGFKITASGVDEHGDAITGYVLGKGDAFVLDDDAQITVGATTYYVHMLDAVPATPRKGDLAVIDNIYQLYDGYRWHPLGNQAEITWSEITGKPTAFPPSAHAASHKTGGSDALTPGDIGAVAAVPGKQLSTNDYTNAEKTKLAGIEAGAEVNPTPVAPSTEIAEGATADAKKVAEFVNSSINAMAAFYITKNAAGDAFATKAELTAAIASGTFYNGGALRTPTKNDYLYVLADESATQIVPGVNPTTRYAYDGAQWAFQIVVNNTALTSAQVAAINSGITAALVSWLSTFKGSDTSTTLASVLTALGGKLDKSGGTATDLSVVEPLTIEASTGGNSAILSIGTIDGVLYISGVSDLNVDSATRTLNEIDSKLNELDDNKVGSFAAVGGVTPSVSGGVADVSALFTSANTSLMGVVRYAFNSDGTIKDRNINAITYAGGALPNFPAQVSGYARDFLLNVTATATASDISLPESGATSVGDALAFTAGKTYLVAITEIAVKKYYIRIIDTTPHN